MHTVKEAYATSNLRKAHVTRDSVGATTWEISAQRAVTLHSVLKLYPNFDADIRGTP